MELNTYTEAVMKEKLRNVNNNKYSTSIIAQVS
jgi:hypothetical protein